MLGTHFTAYRTIWDTCTFLYSLFVLEHRPAHSVPVYNILCLAQSRRRMRPLFSPRCARMPAASGLKPYARYEFPAMSLEQRVPITVCAVTSRLSIVKRLARSPRIAHTYTHTLSPVGGRAINNRRSASPVFTPSYSPRTHVRTICLRYTGYKVRCKESRTNRGHTFSTFTEH